MMKLKPVPLHRRAARLLEATSAHAPGPTTPPPSDVRGLIDNATSDRLFGWAWDASHPGRRLKVELRLAGEVVANTIADFARPDLGKNGVGDGCHAFEFPLLPSWAERRHDLTAIALGVDGTEFPIAVRIRRQDDAQVATQLQRTVEGVVADQQHIRAEFAVLRERVALLPEAAAVDGIARAGQEMQRRIDSLELWITRLDGKLGDLTVPRDGGGTGRLDPWQTVLVAVLASAASAGLALAAARWLG